nr:glycoside hydrolase family 3 C-terminal domain-containing protein [Candidatus Sigynarchaeota archaeon]
MTEKQLEEDISSLPFMNSKLDIEKRVDDLLSRLTFDEKLILCAGFKENSTAPVPRLGIPAFRMSDGPHGIAPYSLRERTATYFPTGIQIASTWNPALAEEFGKAVGEEIKAIGWHMLLGPAVNIARTPMNGRTFEYYAEDPCLAGEIGAAAVKGIQSKRVATCVKHFVANNQEQRRFTVNAVVSQRALHEIYFPAFKRIVEYADPWGFMSSYNKINGIYASEHKEILKNTLMSTWKFKGVVVSDWGATKKCTTIANLIEAGLCVEMGSRDRYKVDEIKKLKDAGQFPAQAFDDNIRRFLRVMFLVGSFDEPQLPLPKKGIEMMVSQRAILKNVEAHQQVARRIAEEGMVLLKNDKHLLPLDINKVKKLAIVGKHAKQTFGRRGGSSAVGGHYEITIRQGLETKCNGKIEIVKDPAKADAAIVCVGLGHTHDFKGGDHEGTDKLRFNLGRTDVKLVNKTITKNPNTIVVLVHGSPFGMEKFIDNAPAVLDAWYGGQELGYIVADIIFGDVNPSGKLPVTFPKHLKDIPAHKSRRTYPGKGIITNRNPTVYYDDGIFIGYRHYDTNRIEPRFPFGHGLSYTTFKYDNLTLSTEKLSGTEKLTLSFDMTNTGERAGAETAQLYVQDVEASVPRPVKELKGFKKVRFAPQEKATVTLQLDKNDLAFFDEKAGTWTAEAGKFKVLVGSSSRD